MEEEIKAPNAGQGLGIAGLVLGIIALIISFIPCLGMYAIIPGIIAIVLSALGFYQASKVNAKKGIVIAAMVISILGTLIAGWQFYIFRNAPAKLEEFGKEIQKVIEEGLDEEDLEELEEAMEELEGEIEELTEEVIDEVGEAVEELTEEIKDAKEELDEDD